MFLFLFVQLSFPLLATAQQTVGKKPNILWLVTEDISPYIAAYGDSTAYTPNLDRLAKEGVRYTNVFSVSGVCAPSRSSLITGMYPASIGTNNMRTLNGQPSINLPAYSVVLPAEVKMFSELLRADGYYCTNNSKQDYQFQAPRSGWDESSSKAHWINRPEGKPFFAVFNFEVTHESQIWKKKNDTLLVDSTKVPLPPYYPESPVIRQDLARMYSNIMEMDREVGIRLKELEDNGLLEETIIFWYSDHGGPVPRGKRELYDSGLHVPMIIRFPGEKQKGTDHNELISFVDFAPTVLSLTGTPIPSYMQGRAFAGDAVTTPPRNFVFAARDRMDTEYDLVRAVRNNRFKYIRNFQPEKPYLQNILYRKSMDLMNELYKFEEEGKLNEVQKLWFRKHKDPEELFDTQTDPYELNNLAAKPEYTELKKTLQKELEGWIDFTNDKGFIPEKEWIASFWPDMTQPLTSSPKFEVKQNKIAISSATVGSSISYKKLRPGQTDKNVAWQLYTGPIALNDGEYLIAIADRIGFKGSEQVVYKN